MERSKEEEEEIKRRESPKMKKRSTEEEIERKGSPKR